MDKLEIAIFEINKIITVYSAALKDHYNNVDYQYDTTHITLTCELKNTQKRMIVRRDSLGSPPVFYPRGLDRQKQGGFKKEMEELERYKKKKTRIEITDGLVISFECRENGTKWERAPAYTYDEVDFKENFQSFFLH